MRFTSVLVLLAALSACNRGTQSKDAVRQGVMDYLTGKGFSMTAMNVELTSVTFNGNHADASVSITAKATPGAGMSKTYVLEQQGSKWVVTGSKDAGGVPHGSGAVPSGAMPGSGNPNGGAMAPGAAGGKMPSPEDLPPTGKKK